MIFVDTGAFVARYMGRDQYHARACDGWRRLETEKARVLTSNFVLDEALTLLGRRTTYAFAAERARYLLSSSDLEILRPDAELELAAVELFAKYADQRISFTDCVSFALMRSHRIEFAFSFDRHFEAAGFSLWPSP